MIPMRLGTMICESGFVLASTALDDRVVQRPTVDKVDRLPALY